MIEYLERNGVKFGADLNAYTSYDETCYNLDNVPTANPATIDTALLILHDWSQFISLEPQEINNERGVIMEELRTRDGAGWRAMVRRNAAVNRGSKYEHRNVIGYLDGLKSFDHKALYDFYKTVVSPGIPGDRHSRRYRRRSDRKQDQNPDGGYSGFPCRCPAERGLPSS